MQKSFKDRLKALEAADRARFDRCRGWIVLDDVGVITDPCPCGRDDDLHKFYVNISPGDWDEDGISSGGGATGAEPDTAIDVTPPPILEVNE